MTSVVPGIPGGFIAVASRHGSYSHIAQAGSATTLCDAPVMDLSEIHAEGKTEYHPVCYAALSQLLRDDEEVTSA